MLSALALMGLRPPSESFTQLGISPHLRRSRRYSPVWGCWRITQKSCEGAPFHRGGNSSSTSVTGDEAGQFATLLCDASAHGQLEACGWHGAIAPPSGTLELTLAYLTNKYGTWWTEADMTSWTPERIRGIADRMAARLGREVRVSPVTLPLVIAALRD
jgi:hypothetical protein